MRAGGASPVTDRRLLSAGLIGLVTAGAFEGMAVPTVLPALVDELGGLDLYGWAFSAFWLTNIVAITLAGIDADRRGPARALAIGAVLFAVGMAISGVAADMSLVIAGRAVQGFGSGAIGSIVYATIARVYPPGERPRMIAMISSAWVVPGLVGPALAGFVSDAVGWRWVFLGIVPPVLLMGLAVYPQLARIGPAQRLVEPVRGDVRRGFDALRLAIGSTILLAALTIGSLPLAIAFAVIGAWLALEALRHLLPPGSLRLARGRPSVVIVLFAIAFAFFGTEAFVPLTVTGVRGGSVTLGGVALSAAAVTWAMGSWVQARAARAGMRGGLVIAGASVIGAGIVVTAGVLLPAAPILIAALGWAIAGLGMGLAYSMLALLMLETATPGEEGLSSAALQLMFTLGTAFGAGVGGGIVALADSGVLELPIAIGLVDLLMLTVAACAVLIATRVPRAPSVGRPAPDAAIAGVPLEHP